MTIERSRGMMQDLEKRAKHFGLSLNAEALARFAAYLAYLRERNQVMNLTAITDPAGIVEKHFLDSLALAQAADFQEKTLIDIGTGAGFPGLPLKIAVPSLRLTLLDGHNKRVRFLEELARELSLQEVYPVHARGEEWIKTPGVRESYDYATSRAVARLNLLLEISLPYVRVGGSFLAMKTADSDGELEEATRAAPLLGAEVELCHDYLLPGTEIDRRIVVFRKFYQTEEVYPRRFAKMQKAPLG